MESGGGSTIMHPEKGLWFEPAWWLQREEVARVYVDNEANMVCKGEMDSEKPGPKL